MRKKASSFRQLRESTHLRNSHALAKNLFVIQLCQMTVYIEILALNRYAVYTLLCYFDCYIYFCKIMIFLALNTNCACCPFFFFFYKQFCVKCTLPKSIQLPLQQSLTSPPFKYFGVFLIFVEVYGGGSKRIKLCSKSF